MKIHRYLWRGVSVLFGVILVTSFLSSPVEAGGCYYTRTVKDIVASNPTTINFEKTYALPLTGYWSDLGVMFSGSHSKAIYVNSYNRGGATTVSGEYALFNDAIWPDTSVNEPLKITFRNPARQVGLYLGNGGADTYPITASIKLFNKSGTQFCSMSVDVNSKNVNTFYGFETILDFYSMTIDYGNTTIGEEIDDLMFSGESTLVDTTNYQCNDYCQETFDKEGVCNIDEAGDMVGSKYCSGSTQCVCKANSCRTDSQCKTEGAHLNCIDNLCVFPGCDVACTEFYGYDYGTCGSVGGKDVGSAFCGKTFEQCKCFNDSGLQEDDGVATCSDTDDGLDPYTKGYTTGEKEGTRAYGRYVDSCSDTVGGSGSYSGKWVVEQHCSGSSNNPYVHTQWNECLSGCENGRCLENVEYDNTVKPNVISPREKQILTNYPRIVTLKWDSIDDATSYNIELTCDRCGGVAWQDYYKWNSKTNYYTTTPLDGDNEFRFKVRAVYGDGSTSQWSIYRYFSYNTSAHVNNVCSETDGGSNYDQKGTLNGILSDGKNTPAQVDDYCSNDKVKGTKEVSGKYLSEYVCSQNGYYIRKWYECPNGCSDGRCLDDNAVNYIFGSRTIIYPFIGSEYMHRDAGVKVKLNYFDDKRMLLGLDGLYFDETVLSLKSKKQFSIKNDRLNKVAFTYLGTINNGKQAKILFEYGDDINLGEYGVDCNLNVFTKGNQRGGDGVYRLHGSDSLYHTTTGVTVTVDPRENGAKIYLALKGANISGALISGFGGEKSFKSSDGKYKLTATYNESDACGGSIITIKSEKIVISSSCYNLSGKGYLAKSWNDNKVWYVDGGSKYWFTSAGVYKSWYEDFSGIKLVDDSILNSLNTGTSVCSKIFGIEVIPNVPAVVKEKQVLSSGMSCGDSAGGDGLYSMCKGDSIHHSAGFAISNEAYTDSVLRIKTEGLVATYMRLPMNIPVEIQEASGREKYTITYTQKTDKHGAFLQIDPQ